MTATFKGKFGAKVHREAMRFWRSVWLFPILLGLMIVGLTVLKINGSSMGIYYQTFYGTTKDPNLVANQPQGIRSDEWLVNTQMSIAQKNDRLMQIDPNIGNGQDMSLEIDVPLKDWSIIFRPHELAFFVMPFDNAFAFRWWVMGYLLIVSCYFFVLTLLP